MTREEQLRLARRDAPGALNRVLAMLAEHRDVIINTAVADIAGGYEAHGDTSFRKTPRELDMDTVDDLGAAVARQIIRRNRYE